MKIKLLGLFLLFAGILYWQDSTSQDKMDKYIAEYNAFQSKADSTTKFADSLMSQIVIAENEARAAQSRAQVYQTQATQLKAQTQNMRQRTSQLSETITDTLELARQLLPMQDSIIITQDSTIKTQDNQISELETALQVKNSALTLALIRGDSLQAVINIIPPAPKNPNRILGFKLPSRKVSFLVGVAMGIGTSILVIK
jgi:chromosome segregation ATPase